ncbi:hypothetical protein OG749_01540 [Streptomyces nojiriensis]|uniref:hypothetical protein n=1 Tax=Streptomyces nojiriensis TaxID=66374 RepID=UPI002E18B78E
MTQLDGNYEERLARLRASLSDEPRVSRSVDRLHRRRPVNILADVTLHAAARNEQGMELSDLEDSLIQVLSAVISDEEIAAAGKAYQEAAPGAVGRCSLPRWRSCPSTSPTPTRGRGGGGGVLADVGERRRRGLRGRACLSDVVTAHAVRKLWFTWTV